jgi:hypothetical protein
MGTHSNEDIKQESARFAKSSFLRCVMQPNQHNRRKIPTGSLNNSSNGIEFFA